MSVFKQISDFQGITRLAPPYKNFPHRRRQTTMSGSCPSFLPDMLVLWAQGICFPMEAEESVAWSMLCSGYHSAFISNPTQACATPNKRLLPGAPLFKPSPSVTYRITFPALHNVISLDALPSPVSRGCRKGPPPAPTLPVGR